MTNRDYSGGARPLALAASIGPTATAFDVDQVLGTWPLGSADGTLPFFIVLSRGTPQEEKVLVRVRSGTTLTVMAGGRGVDDTAANSHGAGSTVEHVWTGTEARESNRHINSPRGVHGLVSTDAVVGQQELADELAAAEAEWNDDIDAAIDAEVIARNDAIDAAVLAADTLSSPVGSILMWPLEAAPTKHFVCRGQAISRATYSELFAVIGTSYGTGDGTTTFNLPDLSGRLPRGKRASDAVGAEGGSGSVTIGAANMPAHAHAIDHDHASVNTNTTGQHGHQSGFDNQSPGSGTGYNHLTQYGDGEANSGSMILANGDHAHSVNLPPFDGVSGSAGGGAALDVTNPFMVMNFIIRNAR